MILSGALCFHQGVIFEKEGDVLLTDSYWTVVLQYDLVEMEEENRNLSILLDTVRGQYDKFFQGLLERNISMHSPVRDLEANFRYEYKGLQQMVADYVGKTSDLVTLLPRTRDRRGLVDAGGHVLKFLFGTLTSSDLDVIDERMDAMTNMADDIFHDTKDQLTVLNNLQSEISNHSKAINKIVTTLKEYHQVMHDSMARNYVRELIYRNQIQTLFQYLKLSSALSEVKDAISMAVQRMTRLHQAVEDLTTGRMTSNLLPPHQYLAVLRSVEDVIPLPAKLFLDVKLENLHNFYKFAIIKSYATETQLRVLIKLPLKNDNREFEIFNVITYPVYEPSLGRWIEWEVDDQKLMVSKDRQTYSVYSPEHYARECTFGQLAVCPLSDVLWNVHKRPSCAVELMLKGKVTLCHRKLISGLHSPVLVRTPTRWIYTTSGETKVVLNCFGLGSGPNISTITLKGVGEIPNRDRCDLIADGYRVPARFIGSSRYSSQPGEITFPEVDRIYDQDEANLMAQDMNETLRVLQELDDRLGTLSVKEYPLESTFQHLRVHYARACAIRYATWGGLPTAMLVIVVLFLGLKWRRRVADLLCARRRGSRSILSSAQTDVPLRAVRVTIPLTREATDQDDNGQETAADGSAADQPRRSP